MKLANGNELMKEVELKNNGFRSRENAVKSLDLKPISDVAAYISIFVMSTFFSCLSTTFLMKSIFYAHAHLI